MSQRFITHFLGLLFVLVGVVLPVKNAAALPENFQDTVIWNGLIYPTAISFSPDGKVFIAEKSGIIKVFDNLQDTTPTIFADLRSKVHEYGDRGLLGLAVDPQFPTRPYVYVLYTMDGQVGSTPPAYNDACPIPDICPVGARLSKLTASGNVMISEQVLMESWCQIENSHSVGTLFFGPDGALYLSHGDGASYNYVDYGQDGGCGDPVNEGGALRSQDLRTTGDAVTFDGALLRLNPDTGAAFAGNPLSGGAVSDDDRIVSYGFRNPYRFSIDPSSGSIWVADVGWNEWEEINYIPSPTAQVHNFGWPCYEGGGRQGGYDAANLPICESLYSAAVARSPYYAYAHNGSGAAISAIAIYRGTNLPAAYNGALFFGDYARGWIKVMMPGTNGLPDPANIVDFIATDVYPTDIKVGPNGALYYIDIAFGAVHQVSYFAINTPPTAQLTASVDSGALPLSVDFNGSGSIDPDAGDTLSYAWDLDGDGQFDDSTVVNPTFVYTQAQNVLVRLRVTDSGGATNIASTNIYAGNRPPVVAITTPLTTNTYNVGDTILFSGTASDPDFGVLPPSALSWQAVLFHCAPNNPNDCHEHNIQTITGVYSGSIIAPDHEYPSRIEFRLTATDSTVSALKRTASVTIEPNTTTWTFTSNPSGLQLSVYGASATTPFTKTVLVNAQSTISAPLLQQFGAASFAFASWSDSGAQTHTVTSSAFPQTFHAEYSSTTVSSVWNSWEVSTQNGDPQAIAISNTNISTPIEFYESVNDLGTVKGALFGNFTLGSHDDTDNHVERFWSNTTGVTAYPYAGKSTVDRGIDTGEDNAPAPLSVRDLQLHPPQNDHTVVAAFRAPQNGTYTISNLGLRRVLTGGTTTRLRVINNQGTVLTTLTAGNNQDWVTTSNIYPIANVLAGDYIYFAVDKDGVYDADAAEISWTISASFSSSAPQPMCTLSSNPTTIVQGESTTLSWTTSDATSFDIDQGIGSQFSVGSGSINQAPATTTTYTGTATGAGGSVQCSTTVNVTPAVTCALSMSPSTITQGGSATLSWTSQNAVSGAINQGIGPLNAPSGSMTVSPTTTTTYTGTANSAGGIATNCSTTLTVTIPPTCSLTANPASIISGNSSLLSWTSANATSISINQGIGSVTPVASGSQSVSPTATTTYTATVTGPGGTNTCARTITVTAPAVPTCTLNASPTTITSGSSSTLSWTTTNATSISINQGIGSVTPVASGSRSVSPTVTTTYTATVTGPGGTNTCTRTITVSAPTVPTCTLSASPTSITQGNSSTLSWTTTNATSISINQGIGIVTPVASGSRSVSPTVTTTYTATVTGPGGTNTCTRSITVTAPTPVPTCTLSANPLSVSQGNSSALSWTTTNATSISINQGIGSVTPVASGSRSVTPTVTTTYTATVNGAGGTNTCTATVTVTPPAVSCALSMSPTVITRGSSATLSWTSQNAVAGSINQGIGSLTAASGSLVVSPTVTTTYTGTAFGADSSSTTCSTTLTVNP